jgi:hypothetical protein
MLRFYARKFAEIGRQLGQLEAALTAYETTDSETLQQALVEQAAAKLKAELSPTLDAIRVNCAYIQLDSATDQIIRITFLLDSPKYTMRQLLNAFIDLQNRVEDELDRRYFLALNPSEGRLYENESPFGDRVGQVFPKCAFDISEAAKALACVRSTACVFHCMRILEVGLHFVGKRLKITIDEDKNWQNILNEIDKAVNNLPAKLSSNKRKKSFLGGAASYLHHVKIAWRNPVMHVRGKYTPEEAENVWNAVRGFMQYLAGPERKKRPLPTGGTIEQVS